MVVGLGGGFNRLEYFLEDVHLEGHHGYVYGEEEDGRGEVDEDVEEVKEEHLEPKDQLALVSCADLLLDLFEGKVTTVDPTLPLPHQPMHGFYRIDLGNRIWQVDQVQPILMDLHAKNAVLRKEDILVVKHLLLRLWLNSVEEVVQKLRKEDPKYDGD